MPQVDSLHSCLDIYLFRTDPKRRRYIGALCGLGYDNLGGGPAFPDNDIEISFDVEMTKEDLMLVKFSAKTT